MCHRLQEGEATIAGRAKLIPLWRHPVRGNNKIALATDLEARLEVSLVRKYVLKPADVAERDRSSIVTNSEMMLRLAGRHVRPSAANKAGLNSPDLKIAKTHRALLDATHALTARDQQQA